jgi:hypothetical protein
VGNWASVCDAGDLSAKALSRGDYSLLPPTKVGNTLTCLATLQPKPSTRLRATHFAAGYVALLQHRLQPSSLGRMTGRRNLARQAQLPRRRRLLPLFVGRGLRMLRREIVGGRIARYAIRFAPPGAEIDGFAAFRTERPPGVLRPPACGFAALRTSYDAGCLHGAEVEVL